MKKDLLCFEEAHTILLCLLYLPIPELIILLIFGDGIVCTLMSILMVIETIAALVVFLFWHKCPECKRVVPQFHIHKDCECHSCGCYLLEKTEVESDEECEDVLDQPNMEESY